MTTQDWKLEARRPKMTTAPDSNRIRMNGVDVKPVRLHGCEMQECLGVMIIRPTDLCADRIRSAFWSGCFWGAIGFGVLAAAILAARGMIG